MYVANGTCFTSKSIVGGPVDGVSCWFITQTKIINVALERILYI
jgi:hypothetical protein